ncbi:carboxymuconolactone decarboxylase family protein [Actinophytocola sp.]|uniref:carboxymuconolactone decarboxylase family protein n=1 Tax=Actinophytocola sp. TaxID=1872138 RepID=UPI003D6C2561
MTDDPHASVDGREIKAQLFGRERAFANRPITEELAPLVKEISDDVLWAKVWAEPTLDVRTRSIVTITTLLALERYDYAELHLHGARRLGVTREELVQVAIQMLFYAGLPVIHTALRLISRVFDADPEDLPKFPSQK